MKPDQINALADRIIADAADDATTAAVTAHLQQLAAWQAYVQGHNARSREYLSFIQAGGYAAFLTIWSATQADMLAWARFGSVVLLAVSLCFFIGYEICKAIVTAKSHNLTHASIFNPESVDSPRSRMFKLEQDIVSATQWAVTVWPPVFGTAAVTGLFGAAILVAGLTIRFVATL